MTREETAQVMLMLMGALRLVRPIVDEALLLSAWHLALADVSADEAQRAATTLLREAQYFPEPSAVRDLVLQERTGIPDSDEAWAIIHEMMHRTYPPGITRAAGAALVEAVRSLGGLAYLRTSTQYQRDRDAFLKLWPQIRTRHMRQAGTRSFGNDLRAVTAVAGEVPEPPPLPDELMSYEDHFTAFYERQAERLKDAPCTPGPRSILQAAPSPAERRGDGS
jgi:hypothetical protein